MANTMQISKDELEELKEAFAKVGKQMGWQVMTVVSFLTSWSSLVLAGEPSGDGLVGWGSSGAWSASGGQPVATWLLCLCADVSWMHLPQ